MRLLVVEDEPDLLSVVTQSLREAGYAVDTAADGEDGLFKAEGTQYDAIVLDLMMPRMDGCELLRTLNDRGEVTPTIVLTSFGDVGHAVTIVHELQAFWFLEKPAQPAVLRSLLDRAIKYGELLRGTERLRKQLSHQGVLDQMVGASKSMQQTYNLIQRAASIGHSPSAPLAATRPPSCTAQALSLPKSSRQAHSRRVKRCSVCSRVKPMAPST